MVVSGHTQVVEATDTVLRTVGSILTTTTLFLKPASKPSGRSEWFSEPTMRLPRKLCAHTTSNVEDVGPSYFELR